MDAIELLTQDHRRVDELFLRYQPLTGDAASARERKRLVAEITRELSVHAAIEERKLYPVVRESVPNGEGMADEAESEHAQVKATLAELEELDPDAPDFDAAVARLIEDVQHHVKEEENELFPKMREALDAARLRTLGRELQGARRSAPKRPSKADRSTTSMVAGVAAAALGRMRTAIGSMTGAGEASSGGARKRSRAGGRRKTTGARTARARTAKSRTAKSRTTKSRATSTKSRAAGTRQRAAKPGTARRLTAAKRASAGAAGGRARSRRRSAGARAVSPSRTRRGRAATARTARGATKRRGAAKTRRSTRTTAARSRAAASRGRKTARVTARRGRAAASRAKKRASTRVKRGTGARRKTGGRRR